MDGRGETRHEALRSAKSRPGSPPAGTSLKGSKDLAADPASPPPLALEAVPEPRSLSLNSVARSLSDGAGFVFGLLAGVVTARWLGPAGKGLFSSLTFVAGLVMQACSVGLGDAAAVMVGQRRATVQRALSSTFAAGIAAAAVGVFLLWGFAAVAFQDDWAEARTAVLLACLGLPISLSGYLLTFVVTAQERIVASSAAMATTSGVTTLALLVFTAVLELSVTGAVLSTVVGAASGLAFAALALRRSGLSLRPQWNWEYLRSALPFGLSVEASYLVTVMFLRVDLLLVYSLAGQAPAGQYSVALTVGGLVALVPIAISSASFPRLARLDDTEANELTAQVFRFGMAAAIVGAAGLAVATPIVVPLLFGSEFTPAVVPSLILAGGGLLWSGEWLLCRAWAARGRPGLLVWSFGLTLVTMCGVDYLLIPSFGIAGAALGSVIAPVVGLVVCLATYVRSPRWPLPLRRFVPGPSDFRGLVDRFGALLRIARKRRAGSTVA